MTDKLLGPDAIQWLGVHNRSILTTTGSGGEISITDTVSPPGSGPSRHNHHDADKTFVLLPGDTEFLLDCKRFTCGPGQTALFSRETDRAFRVVSTVPSRYLVILTPGGFEGFFAEMADGQFRLQKDMFATETAAARFQQAFTGPHLASINTEVTQ